MKSIYIIGAGSSSTAFIEQILSLAPEKGWFITVADRVPQKAIDRVGDSPHAKATWLDITKVIDRREELKRADIVISFLPSHLFIYLAVECVRLKKILIAPSTICYNMFGHTKALPTQDMFFLYDNILKPGLDVFLTAKLLDEVRAEGGDVYSVVNYLSGGGLFSSKENPWKFSVTYDPIGLITSNQGTNQYIENGKTRYLPYSQIYNNFKLLDIPGLGTFEGIVSRGSFFMNKMHDLGEIQTFIRGTLRNTGFCKSWEALIKLGLTDNKYPIFNSFTLTYQELVESFVSNYQGITTKEKVANFLQLDVEDAIVQKIEYLGLFSRRQIRLERATPAEILSQLVIEKWSVEEKEKDASIVYTHIEYTKGKRKYSKIGVLTTPAAKNHTAMSKFQGLPMAFLLKNMDKIEDFGPTVTLTQRNVYEMIFEELQAAGATLNIYNDLV